jgi:hypothetical protein
MHHIERSSIPSRTAFDLTKRGTLILAHHDRHLLFENNRRFPHPSLDFDIEPPSLPVTCCEVAYQRSVPIGDLL